MFAATTPAFRVFFSRPQGEGTAGQERRARTAGRIVSVCGRADETLTGRWFVVAGYACRAGSGTSVRGRRLVVERAESRSLWSRIVDRLAGRDGYRVLWQDDRCGHAVIARGNAQQLWIMSRSPDMPTRDLFRRVAELRELGYDTRPIRYAHIG